MRTATRTPPAPAPEPATSVPLHGLGRLGRFVSHHHRWFGAAWLVAIVLVGWQGSLHQSDVSDNFRVPNTDSQAAYDLLGQRFSSQNAASATVVFTAAEGTTLETPANAAAVAAATAAMEKVDGVASASNPLTTDPPELLRSVLGKLSAEQTAVAEQLVEGLPTTVSEKKTAAVSSVSFHDTLNDLLDRYPPVATEAASDYTNPYSQLQRTLDRALADSQVKAWIGGTVADTWNVPVSFWASHADEVGLVLGALLLLVAFGSLFGMLVPIGTALFGAITAASVVYILAGFTSVSSAAPPVTLMISIGVGLDYSLLIVTRHRQFIREGYDPHDAVGLALSTAGKAAMFAGITVCIALLGLWLVPIPLVQTMGLAAALGVATMVVAALTLLPALLGFAGARIDRVMIHRADADADPESGFWGRFAARMSAHPWVALLAGVAVLVVLAIPFTRIQFGMPGDDSQPASLSQHTAYLTAQEEFGAGYNAPLLVVVGLPEAKPYAEAAESLRPVSTALAALKPPGSLRGVEYSVGPVPNDASTTSAVIYAVTPTTGPDSEATSTLVRDLRSRLAVATRGTDLEAHVGGPTATLIDLSDLVVHYLPIVIGAVVLGAFVLLVLVFRSLLVPLKAAIMNLLSIAAAYGVVVAVFQLGWGKGLVGVSETIPIVSFVPLIMFVILFGLSMDYEVFLMSRIKEEWDASGEPRRSVVRGVGGTARVITTAALVMIVVFLAFVANPSPTVKLIGFGMAVAVLLDSTIVRMVLVPAVMELLGAKAWWFPTWLGWLPHLDVEGKIPPAPGSSDPPTAEAVATDGPGVV